MREDKRKAVQKRRGDPPFDIAIEVKGFNDWIIHEDIAAAVVRKRIDDSSTSFFVNSRTLMGCTDPLEGGSAHPISFLSESVASYLCSLMLTCAHSNDSTPL